MYHLKQHGDDDVTDPLKKKSNQNQNNGTHLDSSSSFIIYKEKYHHKNKLLDWLMS